MASPLLNQQPTGFLKLPWAQKFKLGLKLATELVPKLPSRGDTALQVAVKVLSIVDSTQSLLSAKYKEGPMSSLIRLYNLESTKNEQFVSLFFETNLYQQFDVDRFSLTDYLDVVAATHPRFGTIFFSVYSYGDGPEPTFYHTKGMPFSDILDGLWESYNGRLHVTITRGEYGKSRTEFATFSVEENPIYGPMKDRLEALVERHRNFTGDGYPRSYMFYGEPGGGKSSGASKFAGMLGRRTVKMDAVSLSHAHVKEITFLLNSLRPDFIIFDDMDKADVTTGLPTVLDIIQRFKTDHKTTSIIMTANTVSTFDAGLLRPGRIDTWVKFELPDDAERRTLLTSYMKQFEAQSTSKKGFNDLVRTTKGLSHDYLRELALQLRYESVEHVLGNVKLMKELLKAATDGKPAPGGEPPGKLTTKAAS